MNNKVSKKPTDVQLGIDIAARCLKDLDKTVKQVADLYAAAYKQYNDHATARWNESFPRFTYRALRLLLEVANNTVLPELFFISNEQVLGVVRRMPIKDQKVACNQAVEVWCPSDKSSRLMFVKNMDTATLAQVYDSKGMFFRTLQGQESHFILKQMVENTKLANTVKRAEDLVAGKTTPVKPAAPLTKSQLIKLLKDLKPTAEDLTKLADTSTLMDAAKLSITVKA